MKHTLLTALLLTTLPALHAADVPRHTPESPVMLSGSWVPENPHQLDFASLPKLTVEHAVVSDVRDLRSAETVAKPNSLPPMLKHGGCNLHNYLAHHNGQVWAMWSDGPGIEDRVGQSLRTLLSGGERPTAIFTFEARHAATAQTWMARHGVAVPEQMSLLSRNDEPCLAQLVPEPAHYERLPEAFAKKLAQLVISAGSGVPLKQVKHLILPTFVRGETLGRPPVP